MGKVKLTEAQKRERKRLYYIQWRKDNPEKSRKATADWRARNPGKSKELSNRWKKGNPAAHAAINANRKAAQMQRTAAWADQVKIKELYRLAAAKEGRFHVDHIIPMQGEFVSGLHVESNLQILEGKLNESKRNSFNYWWQS